MNSKIKNIIIGLLIVVVFVVIFFLSEALKPVYLEEVTYSEYKELIKKDAYVFVGDKGKNYSEIEDLARDNNSKVYYLNEKKLTDKQKENLKLNALVKYSEEKEELVVDNFDNYKSIKSLIKAGFLENQLIQITIPEYFEILKESGYNFIFFGSSECGYCTKFKPELATVASVYDVNLYYIDLYAASDKDMQDLYASDTYFSTEEWGTPLNFLMKDGKRVAVLNGYNDASAVIEFFKSNNVIK